MATCQPHHQIQIGCGCAKRKENGNCFSHDLPPPEKKPKLKTSHDDDAFSDYEDDEYFSDNEIDGDGLHDMTMKEFRIYNEQVEKSGGFDVDDFPKVSSFCMITPIIPIPQKIIDLLTDFANIALVQYNKANGTNWEFAKLIKANEQADYGIIYYITFEVRPMGASDDDFSPQIFQAKVYSGIQDFDVELCRPKPNH